MPVADQPALRRVLAHFATGVTVVSARAGTRSSGLTANAVASICLEPPLVMAAVEHTSDTHTVIERSGSFAISILREEHADLSRRFASDLEGKFEGVDHRPGVTGSPLLDDALAHLECRVVEALVRGDHTIFIGEVVASSHSPSGRPLIFFQSGYHRLRKEP
ncbi:MAG: flavin reductase family protein [Candidatus Dormibacteraceae bacterium]